MAENIDLQIPQEIQSTTVSEIFDLSYFTKKLNVARYQVIRAIKAVGYDRGKVGDYLIKHCVK